MTKEKLDILSKYLIETTNTLCWEFLFLFDKYSIKSPDEEKLIQNEIKNIKSILETGFLKN